MNGREWGPDQREQVQRLALSGYDFDCSAQVLLEIVDAAKTRSFLASLLADGLVTFGDKGPADTHGRGALDVGFTHRGLKRIGLAPAYLEVLKLKAAAFCEGAPQRAARCLGDAGESAVERWDEPFRSHAVDLVLSIHGSDLPMVRGIADTLEARPDAREALAGWVRIEAEHLSNAPTSENRKLRTVHFGFRDDIARPAIPSPNHGPDRQVEQAGELLIGYRNNQGVDLWDERWTSTEVAGFFRNGSFAVLRRIEQEEGEFDRYLDEQVRRLTRNHPYVTREYLKAKLCGRWPNGVRVLPGETTPPNQRVPDDAFDFKDDPYGHGCPFGAHIRRTNPRGDPLALPRLRPLFRRSMPYGQPYGAAPADSRGLLGLFFCASIEDQVEHLMSEWVEKNPMGPPNRGDAKDPLIGRHDEPAAFHVPRPGSDGLMLYGFRPFVRTRGTLYLLYPSRAALTQLAGRRGAVEAAAVAVAAAAGSGARGVRRAAAAASARLRSPASSGPSASIESDTAPSDRFCDIVMEGGVTSGIIYSTAVVELAKNYRFQSIGGSSIGAFAAALTAAAEYRRRLGSIDGFRGLAELPDKLAEEEGGRTLLERLFQPQPGTRRLFEIFRAMLNRGSMTTRLLSGLAQAVRQYWLAAVAVAVVLAAGVLAGPLASLWCPACTAPTAEAGAAWVGVAIWLAPLLLVLAVAALAGPLLGILWDLRRVAGNGFGLCRGWCAGASPTTLDLGGFLHASIQNVAGLTSDRPLTFAQLWEAPGNPTGSLADSVGVNGQRSINLQVYVTNLAHGRPYRFPLDDPRAAPPQRTDDDMGRLFFRVEELRDYFPEPILRHLQQFSRPYEKLGPSDPNPDESMQGLRELPAAHLPVVVAARMALSFPLLVSAVPLHAIDYERPRGDRRLARCWMSDGGLCSNFPIHLFDSFVPKWPTFGISLQTRGKYRPEQRVWLPNRHYEGRGDTWYRAPEEGSALARLIGFLTSLWLATWRWNDMTMMRMPGVRDRVVRVFLQPGEGGVNIRMTAKQIRRLAETYGKEAARHFLEKFAMSGSPGWPEHRWVRFNRLLIALREQVDGLAAAAALDRHTLPLGAQIKAARGAAPLRGHPHDEPGSSEKLLDNAQAAELRNLLAALLRLESAFRDAGDAEPYRAAPRPSLRVRHPT